eukprot:3788149-Ditylum_brightwellii.AAC.1
MAAPSGSAVAPSTSSVASAGAWAIHFSRLKWTVCTAPSISASVPAQSCRFEHAALVSSPFALITSLVKSRRTISPTPAGCVPWHLSSATRWHAIRAL